MGILNFSSTIFIEGMCIIALAPTIMTKCGSIFHPLLIICKFDKLYFEVVIKGFWRV